MRTLAFFLFLTLLTGCASTYQQNTVAEPSTELDRSKTVLVGTPANGFYGSTEYKNSGKMTASAVHAAFSRFASVTTISPECADISCLERTPGYDYYAIAEILHWEDRATEWSGIPDRMEVKLSIFDANKNELASAVISGKSSWATFGGDHPQDLLPEPLNQYVGSLY